MPRALAPLVATLPVLKISTSPPAARASMPVAPAPLVVTLPLVMLTPPFGPSTAAPPG